MDEGALVDSTGPGTGACDDRDWSGTGGGAGSENFGVLVEGADTQIRSVSGDVTVIGTGGGDGFGSGNKGIVIRDSDLALESSGTGATGAMITSMALEAMALMTIWVLISGTRISQQAEEILK